MVHLHCRRQTWVWSLDSDSCPTQKESRDQSPSLCNVNIFFLVQCSHWVKNINLSLRQCKWAITSACVFAPTSVSDKRKASVNTTTCCRETHSLHQTETSSVSMSSRSVWTNLLSLLFPINYLTKLLFVLYLSVVSLNLHRVPFTTSNSINKNRLVLTGNHCKWTFLTLVSIRSVLCWDKRCSLQPVAHRNRTRERDPVSALALINYAYALLRLKFCLQIVASIFDHIPCYKDISNKKLYLLQHPHYYAL